MSNRKTTTEIIIHCSATPPDMDIGVEEIDQWHRQRGWNGCGYHYVIRRDGTVEEGRPDDQVGAHAKGHNAFSVGVCMVGGLDEDGEPDNNFTSDQCTTLVEILGDLVCKYPKVKVVGHNEISAKSCPSFDVQEWLGLTGFLIKSQGFVDTCPACGHPL